MDYCLFLQDQALATFNFLNAEKRYVAGAFIPPSYILDNDEDMMYTSMIAHKHDPNITATDYDYLSDDEEEQQRLADETAKSKQIIGDKIFNREDQERLRKKGHLPPPEGW